jgi:hypothetical protein
LVFSKLETAYTEFGNLCNYDASGQTEAALTQVVAAVNEYASAINQAAPLSDPIGTIIEKGGGLLAAEVQWAVIKAASVRMRGILTNFKALLAKPIIKSQFTTFYNTLISRSQSNIETLIKKDVYDLNGILNEVGEEMGLSVKKDFKPSSADKNILIASVINIVSAKYSDKSKKVLANYDASCRLIDELIAAHSNLENNSTINVSDINRIIIQLQQFALILSQSKTKNQ